jgi:hypothetical protein
MLLLGCQKKPSSLKPEMVYIDMEESLRPQKILLSSYVDSVHYIPIHLPQQPVFSDRLRILDIGTHLTVIDNQTDRVGLFDPNGQFLNSIGQIGKGPGEYIELTSIVFLKSAQQFLIFCRPIQKILVYDLEGRFIRDMEVPYWMDQLVLMQDNQLLLFKAPTYTSFNANDPTPHVLIMNLQGEVVLEKHLFTPLDFPTNIYYRTAIFLYQDSFYVRLQMIPDTIYQFNQSFDLIPQLIIQSPQMPTLSSRIDAMKNHSIETQGLNVYGLSIFEPLLFLNGSYNRISMHRLYERKTKKWMDLVYDPSYYYNGLLDDIDGGPLFWPNGRGNELLSYQVLDTRMFKWLENEEGLKSYEGIKRSSRMDSLMKWSISTHHPVFRKVYFKH